MDTALTLEACPTMFDELASILKQDDCSVTLRSSDSIVRGIRRMDTARYNITLDGASVELWAERRIGNPTMFLLVVPMRKSIWRPDPASDSLAGRIVDLLVAHGASCE